MRKKSLIELESCFPDYDALWNPASLTETESMIRSRLPMDGSVGIENISALLQAVRLSCIKNQLSEAKNFLSYAEQLIANLEEFDKLKMQIRYKLEQGRYYSFMMSPTHALEAFRSAWEMSKETEKLDFFAIDAVYMISLTLPLKEGKEWLYLGLSLAEKSTNEPTKKWLPHLQLAVGWDYFDKYDFNNSLDIFVKGESNCESDYSLLRILRWSKARVLRALKRIDEAIQIQKEILIEDGGMPCEENGFVYLELAELHAALQHESKAKDYYVLAFQSLKLNKMYSENYEYELCAIEKKSQKRVYHS